jgi:hypothetical protein
MTTSAGVSVDGKVVNYQPFNEAGKIDPEQAKQFQTRGNFDVRVSTDSSLPFNKAEKEQRLLNFYDRQIVDAEEVLKGTDYPNWQSVLQRMEQKQAQQAEAAAQAKMQGNGAPPAA